jgi:hypothetical protein
MAWGAHEASILRPLWWKILSEEAASGLSAYVVGCSRLGALLTLGQESVEGVELLLTSDPMSAVLTMLDRR